MDRASLKEIRDFLGLIKRAIEDHRFRVIPRDKNNQTLAQLGLTKRIQEDIILGLTPADYHQGPISDLDKPGMLWVFGSEFEGRYLYIKLKLVERDSVHWAICLSFHLAEFPLSFPYGEERG